MYIKHKKQPAFKIVTKIGGVRATARVLGIAPSAVTRWLSASGVIPQRHFGAILLHAKKQKLGIEINDLLTL
mgnify:FL=1|tara:strand:+ start:901 stop:1116 length:216 start_codon:yes stop_codon:yes gene_type:complete